MKISLVNNEVEIPLEKQLMEKMTKQFENFFDIKHSNKDNILTGANNIYINLFIYFNINFKSQNG
jgi:hypothetical protein